MERLPKGKGEHEQVGRPQPPRAWGTGIDTQKIQSTKHKSQVVTGRQAVSGWGIPSESASRANEMAQPVKELATETGNLNSIPGTHMRKRKPIPAISPKFHSQCGTGKVWL